MAKKDIKNVTGGGAEKSFTSPTSVVNGDAKSSNDSFLLSYKSGKVEEGLDALEEAKKSINSKSADMLSSIWKLKGNPSFNKYIVGNGISVAQFDRIQESVDNSVKMIQELEDKIANIVKEIEEYNSSQSSGESFKGSVLFDDIESSDLSKYKLGVMDTIFTVPTISKSINSNYDVLEMKEKKKEETSTYETLSTEKVSSTSDNNTSSLFEDTSSNKDDNSPLLTKVETTEESDSASENTSDNALEKEETLSEEKIDTKESIDETTVESEASVVATQVENTNTTDNVTVYEGPVKVVGAERINENVVSNQNYVPHNNQNDISSAPQPTSETSTVEPTVELPKSADTTPSINTQKKITPITIEETSNNSKSHSNPLPIIGGLAVAGTAIGLGTKAVLNRRNNISEEDDSDENEYEEIIEDEDTVIEDGSEIIEPSDNMSEGISYEDVDDSYEEEDLVNF